MKHLRWAAIPVLAIATLGAAACGNSDGDSADVRTAPAVVEANGSDRHLTNAAIEAARQARANQAATDRLQGQADQAERAETARAVAAAEAAERTAHLEGQARTYEANSASVTRSYGDEHRQPVSDLVAGNRAALQAQADAYVQQLQDRAPDTDASVNTWEAGNRAAAEAIERQAHLDGQARTYGDEHRQPN
jgi:hypothetical protein